jgi:beta-glucanase (GH16 family)
LRDVRYFRCERWSDLGALSPVTALVVAALAGCTNDLSFRIPATSDPSGPVGPSGRHRLTFSEECDEPLDPQRINTFMPDTNGGSFRTWNLRAEYIADENVRVEGGECQIIAERRPNGGRDYTSGAINTGIFFQQSRGYFEARIWPPAGRGFWIMWWLRDHEHGWPPAVEAFNFSPDNPRFTTQFYTADGDQYGTGVDQSELTTGYHVVGVEWTASELIGFFDGVERARFSSGVEELSSPMYPALNLSIHTGEIDPPPDDTTPWPGVLRVDWIRVWQKD